MKTWWHGPCVLRVSSMFSVQPVRCSLKLSIHAVLRPMPEIRMLLGNDIVVLVAAATPALGYGQYRRQSESTIVSR